VLLLVVVVVVIVAIIIIIIISALWDVTPHSVSFHFITSVIRTWSASVSSFMI
jgi:hypothetical protein